ncbi:hypothetical protein CJ184_004065 [Actinotignum urinale]|uniref:Uncharacterized protein n=1 Tax=Actinotignum urinale TaxID=190146 RepID=A0AAW9HJZ4_9ACTO|nr:hypothetical protein [Actinotignum urinale]MDY5154236.1 hypothetical protein [Actinotignum urinale]WIK58454.1 hypothetical protein CJ184_004065 [Actinotignum urinale]
MNSRKHAPAIRLSSVDQARVDSGELADAHEALRQAARQQHSGSNDKTNMRKKAGESASLLSEHDIAILRECPPHFGKL